MKEIEQNEAGNIFAIPYLDNGRFRVRVFEIPERGRMDANTNIERSREEI